MKTAASQPLSLHDAVAPQLHRRLRDRIIACDLTPGQRISETEIATTYQVSRQPVREAFIKLAEERLVQIRPQRGTYIRRISAAATLTARFIREAVEADLVVRTVERATPEMIAELDQHIAHQRTAATAKNPAKFMLLDERFHAALAQFADAAAVTAYLDVLNAPMTRVRNLAARKYAPGKLVEQHAAIVDAIRHRDAASAAQAMRRHLGQIVKDLPQIIEAFPDYFEDVEALP